VATTQRKRRTDPPPSGPVGAWALLAAAINDTLVARPEGSVTPDELAAVMGVSHSRAAFILRHRADLRAVHYRVNGRRGLCYVPAEAT